MGPAGATAVFFRANQRERDLAIAVRIGLHTGDVLTAGTEFVGMTVHIGARISKLAGGGEVLVSHTVRDLVRGPGVRFTPRGRHVLKGVPGVSELFALDMALEPHGPCQRTSRATSCRRRPVAAP